jgi:hypothetical protein
MPDIVIASIAVVSFSALCYCCCCFCNILPGCLRRDKKRKPQKKS